MYIDDLCKASILPNTDYQLAENELKKRVNGNGYCHDNKEAILLKSQLETQPPLTQTTSDVDDSSSKSKAKDKENNFFSEALDVAEIIGAAAAIGGAIYAISQSGGTSGYSAPANSDQGCCSWHNGISHCDIYSHRLVCMDNQYSPSCGC